MSELWEEWTQNIHMYVCTHLYMWQHDAWTYSHVQLMHEHILMCNLNLILFVCTSTSNATLELEVFSCLYVNAHIMRMSWREVHRGGFMIHMSWGSQSEEIPLAGTVDLLIHTNKMPPPLKLSSLPSKRMVCMGNSSISADSAHWPAALTLHCTSKQCFS